ncbi:MAG: hypothetical protein ACOX0T_07425 [Pelotomaculum sp.]
MSNAPVCWGRAWSQRYQQSLDKLSPGMLGEGIPVTGAGRLTEDK